MAAWCRPALLEPCVGVLFRPVWARTMVRRRLYLGGSLAAADSKAVSPCWAPLPPPAAPPGGMGGVYTYAWWRRWRAKAALQGWQAPCCSHCYSPPFPPPPPPNGARSWAAAALGRIMEHCLVAGSTPNGAPPGHSVTVLTVSTGFTTRRSTRPPPAALWQRPPGAEPRVLSRHCCGVAAAVGGARMGQPPPPGRSKEYA